MTDREALMQVISSLGLILSEDEPTRECYAKNEYKQFEDEIIIGSGDGYSGFQVSFKFDSNGKVISHDVWE